MSEIYVPEGSRFVGVLESRDKLLCFGKLESMRSMVPERSRRRRRPQVKELATDTARA